MGKFGFGLIGLVIGLAAGVFGAITLGGGAMTGIGVGTGLSAGICSTVIAAQEEGLLSAEQVDRVLVRAANDLAAMANSAGGEALVGSAAACEDVMERIRAAQG